MQQVRPGCGRCSIQPELRGPLPTGCGCGWIWKTTAEFIGRFVPDDLPLWLRWRDGVCVQAALLLDVEVDAGVASMAEGLRLQPLAVPGDVPDLWAGFARGVWSPG